MNRTISIPIQGSDAGPQGVNHPTLPAKPTARKGRRFSAGAQADPTLTFSPMAWLKLRLFLHADDVEVGGFGISAANDLLYVEEFVTVKQSVTLATVEFDDVSVADHFDACIDRGIVPARCGRIWLHTHPGSSAEPSLTDERTFARVFGHCDWALMGIVARGGASFARIRFAAGPGGETSVPVRVDWERCPKELLDREGKLDELFSAWMDEYGRNIHAHSGLLFTEEELEELSECNVFHEDFPHALYRSDREVGR